MASFVDAANSDLPARCRRMSGTGSAAAPGASRRRPVSCQFQRFPAAAGPVAFTRLRGRRPCGKNRPLCGAVFGRFSTKPRACCRSSVVEHSLGKGEVVSSILPGSTIKTPCFTAVFALFPERLSGSYRQNRGETWHRQTGKIRGNMFPTRSQSALTPTGALISRRLSKMASSFTGAIHKKR
jgi:hypothetical protein